MPGRVCGGFSRGTAEVFLAPERSGAARTAYPPYVWQIGGVPSSLEASTARVVMKQ